MANMRKLKKLVIFLGYSCNNNCSFCINSSRRNIVPDKTSKEVIKEIYMAAKKEKIDIIEFIGGEATIRKDFFEIIKIAKKLKIPSINIATNGRAFSNFEFAKKAVESGLSSIIFSIHGHNSSLHDKLTRSEGSFEDLIKGINNLRKIGFANINANTTVVKSNYRYLPKIAELHIKLNIKDVEYIFVDPQYGGAYENFNKLVPRISKAAPFMRKALEIGIKNGFNRWKVRYVPLCYFREYIESISEINEARAFVSKHWAPDFKNDDVVASRKLIARIKTEKCKSCRFYYKCEGMWKEYIARYGDEELKPVEK